MLFTEPGELSHTSLIKDRGRAVERLVLFPIAEKLLAMAVQRALVLLVLVVATLGFSASSPIADGIRQVTDHHNESGGALAGELAHALCGAKAKFESFKNKFGKVYESIEEHEHRFGVFKDNLVKALKHQALDPTASHGVTQFSDLTEEEFANHYLGLKRPAALASAPEAPTLPTDDLPPNFDWRDKGAVSAVKNQVILKLLKSVRVRHLGAT